MKEFTYLRAGLFAVVCIHFLMPSAAAIGSEARSPNFTKPNFTKPNFTKPNFTKPNFTKRSLAKRRTTRPGQGQASHKPPVSDVLLSAGGLLEGAVVDVQGIPVDGTPIIVRQNGREIARTTSDAAGRFWFRGLRGGVHQIVAAHGSGVYRLWSPATAPPSSRNGVLIIARGDVLRGQIPLQDILSSDKVLFGGVVLGAIAIPVVIYNNRGSGS